MSKNKGEPSLDKIDDFKGRESKSKSNTVRLIILSLLVLGAILTYFKNDNSKGEDYLGTKEVPVLDITKKVAKFYYFFNL